MAPSSHNTVIVLRCRRDGTLIDVPYINSVLDPAAGKRFDYWFAPVERRKARRFLSAVAANKPVLNRKLSVVTPAGAAPLFFSGTPSGSTLVMIATKEPFDAGHSVPDLTSPAAHQRSVVEAIRKLESLNRTHAGSARTNTRRGQSVARHIGTSQLLRLIAHDLTNPISGILAASQFLLEDSGHSLDHHQSTLLKSIESSSQFALQFIDGILELSSIPSGNLQLQLQQTDVGTLAAACLDQVRRRAESRRIALEAKTAGAPATLNLDRQRMSQALGALLRNELEYRAPGSTVCVTVSARDRGAEIAVASRGPVPPAGSVRAILQTSGAPSRKTLSEIRTALSLSAVTRIVKAHRGSIRREEDPAGDAVYRITLPASAHARSERTRSRSGVRR